MLTLPKRGKAGLRLLGERALRSGLQQELVLFAGERRVVQVILGDLALGEQRARAQRAGGVLRAEELVLADGGLEAAAIVQVAAGFGEQLGDSVDGFGRVWVTRIVVINSAKTIHNAGVFGARARGFNGGLEGVARALGCLPWRDGGGVGPAVARLCQARRRMRYGGVHLRGERQWLQAYGGERQCGRSAAERRRRYVMAADARRAHATLRVSGHGADR